MGIECKAPQDIRENMVENHDRITGFEETGFKDGGYEWQNTGGEDPHFIALELMKREEIPVHIRADFRFCGLSEKFENMNLQAGDIVRIDEGGRGSYEIALGDNTIFYNANQQLAHIRIDSNDKYQVASTH
ncbi:hypothetical protein MK079_03165 [Candidatus Gracilibacteria bacterium]|nr:hypothetical protein [Candidatus Gracilibacteria bacterium]